MELAVAIAPYRDCWKAVRRAEELGFANAWFYDSQMLYPDVFVVMTQAAMNTKRIRLGTGVLIPSNRIAPVAANAFGALERLARGRIDCGIGTGFTGRRTMGLGAMRLSEMAEYIRILQALWAGETLEWTFEGERRKIRFLDGDTTGFAPEETIPLHISAFAPKARALAAELADGWMNFFLGDDAAVAAAGLMDESLAEKSREPATLRKTLFALGCVLEDGEPADGPRALAQAAPVTAVLLHTFAEAEERGAIAAVPAELRDLVDAYRTQVYGAYEPEDARYLDLHRGHLLYVKPEERPFLPPDLVRATSLTGTKDELRDRVRRLAEAGYDQLAIQIVPGGESALEDWAGIFAGL